MLNTMTVAMINTNQITSSTLFMMSLPHFQDTSMMMIHFYLIQVLVLTLIQTTFQTIITIMTILIILITTTSLTIWTGPITTTITNPVMLMMTAITGKNNPDTTPNMALMN
jgi:hypothetical protein